MLLVLEKRAERNVSTLTEASKISFNIHVAEIQIMCSCWDCFKKPIKAFYLGHTPLNLPVYLNAKWHLSHHGSLCGCTTHM